MYSKINKSEVLVQDNIITQEDILRICEEREKEDTIYYSFEEAYELWLNYIPKI